MLNSQCRIVFSSILFMICTKWFLCYHHCSKVHSYEKMMVQTTFLYRYIYPPVVLCIKTVFMYKKTNHRRTKQYLLFETLTTFSSITNNRKLSLVETGLKLFSLERIYNRGEDSLASRENKNKHGDHQCNGEYQSL